MVEVTIGAHTRHHCVEVRRPVAVTLALCPFCLLSDSFSKLYGKLAVLSAKKLPVSGAVHVPMYFTGLRSYIRVQLHTGNFRSLGNHNTYCCSNHCRSDRKSCFDTPQRCPFIASFLKVKLCCDVSVCNQHVFSPTNNL